jgi:copper chaperone CopZ
MTEKKVTMRVFGMTCDDCVRTVTDGLEKQGADVLSISLSNGIAIVKIDDAKISAENLIKAPVFGEESHYKAQLRRVE